MGKQTHNDGANIFSQMMSIAFLLGLIIFEISLFRYFSEEGSPWLYIFFANALYLVVAFFIIGGLSMLGSFGMAIGYIAAIAGLYILGISTLTL